MILIMAKNELNLELEEEEDPWMVIWTLRTYLSKFSSNGSVFPKLKSPCGEAACPRIEGDIEFERALHDDRLYKPQQITCARCGQGGALSIESLPTSFYVRLLHLRRGTFDSIRAPKFDGYKCNRMIQYNPISKHFRHVRIHYGSIEISDGANFLTQKTTDADASIHKGGWKTYICLY
jgi:hypothetical protein